MPQPKVFAIDGVTPVVDPSSYVHPSAVLIGDVVIGSNCYIGPGACLRGDFGRILIGDGANVQDNCIMHGFPGTDTIVEENGHIGHGAILHGCRVRRGALIGMNSVVNDNADIGEAAIVAALSFVKAEMVVPPRMLAAGSPARILRALTAVEMAWKAEGTRSYQDLTLRCLATMRETVALAAPEPDRKRLQLPELLPLSELKAKA
ncbi:MAG: transferase hexapeptide repeat family protein [Betaproteobacteria bacterium]|nr:transferase hexapeptide repeat family protein [Betaproteobacteria bacterium]